MSAVAEIGCQPYRWTRAQYDLMVDAGILTPESHVELIEGEVIAMTPQGSPHAVTTGLIHRQLQQVFAKGYWIRIQMPLAINEDSEPEPDVAVVAGDIRDFTDAHPGTALLVVEVAENTLTQDRGRKQRLYARAGIPEYWIVNLADGQVEVYREPAGETYRQVRTFKSGDVVSPLAAPESAVAVADLLP